MKRLCSGVIFCCCCLLSAVDFFKLNNNIKHNRNVNTYTTTFGNETKTPTNNAPVANNDSVKTECGAPIGIDVLNNDKDADNDALTILNFTQPANGKVTRDSNGGLLYTPNAGVACGTDDSFSYTVSDGNGGTSTANVTVTVSEDENTKPDAVSDKQSTGFNSAVSIDVLGNDTDPKNDTLNVTTFTQGSNGVVTVGSDGELVYTPNDGFSGLDTFTYTISNSNGETDTATVYVTVGDSTKPDAVSDKQSTDFNSAVSIDVLSNDTDPENDTLNVTTFTQGSNGLVTVGSDGELVYTPNDGYSGLDTFTYTISNSNGETDSATVYVTVGDAPVVEIVTNAKDDVKSTMCSAITINVLDNDEGDSLSLLSVDVDSLMYGTVQQSGNQIIYTPSNTCGKGNTGVDDFSYTIKDGNGNTDSANVEVTVKGVVGGSNTQANMDDAMLNSGDTVTLNVLDNDSGNGLRIIAVDHPANGKVSFTNSTVTYTATGTGSYTDTFYYDIVDANGYNDSAMIIIDVVGGCVKDTKCH